MPGFPSISSPAEGWASFAEGVARALAGPLPGPRAHLRMAVAPRPGWVPGLRPPDAIPGAALVALAPGAEGPAVILTKRASGLRRHGGQVSFPGGRVEPGESLVQGALREAHEEIGLDPAAARVIGELSHLHVPVSDFVIHPFVALLADMPAWRRDEREVEAVLEVPLVRLADPAGRTVETWDYQGAQYLVPLFPFAGEKIWGATAMILSELLWLAGSPIGEDLR